MTDFRACGTIMGRAASRELRDGVPMIGKPRKLARLGIVEPIHLQRPESDPTTTRRAAASEANPLPKGPNERVVEVHFDAVRFEHEVYPLHAMATAMRAQWAMVVDVRRRHRAQPSFAVRAIVLLKFFVGEGALDDHSDCPLADRKEHSLDTEN
jgi:hypothetical protein